MVSFVARSIRAVATGRPSFGQRVMSYRSVALKSPMKSGFLNTVFGAIAYAFAPVTLLQIRKTDAQPAWWNRASDVKAISTD